MDPFLTSDDRQDHRETKTTDKHQIHITCRAFDLMSTPFARVR